MTKLAVPIRLFVKFQNSITVVALFSTRSYYFSGHFKGPCCLVKCGCFKLWTDLRMCTNNIFTVFQNSLLQRVFFRKCYLVTAITKILRPTLTGRAKLGQRITSFRKQFLYRGKTESLGDSQLFQSKPIQPYFMDWTIKNHCVPTF